MTNATDAAPSGIRWHTTGWTPENPFTGQLIWSDEAGPVHQSTLTPILVRDLVTALAAVHEAQRTALIGDADASIELPASTGDEQWAIQEWTAQNPFAGQLVWSDADGPIVWVNLDALLVKNLLTELATILLAQREALGLPNDATETAPTERDAAADQQPDPDGHYDDYPEEEDEEVPTEIPDVRSRWRRHPWKTGFLLIILLPLLFSIIAGGAAIG